MHVVINVDQQRLLNGESHILSVVGYAQVLTCTNYSSVIPEYRLMTFFCFFTKQPFKSKCTHTVFLNYFNDDHGIRSKSSSTEYISFSSATGIKLKHVYILVKLQTPHKPLRLKCTHTVFSIISMTTMVFGASQAAQSVYQV